MQQDSQLTLDNFIKKLEINLSDDKCEHKLVQ
jgi:hypothetical protein